MNDVQLLDAFKQQDPSLENATFDQIASYLQTDFTVNLVALNNLEVAQGSGIMGSRIRAYAFQLEINGNVDTSGLGCRSDWGVGAGIPGQSSTCAGGGAAHAGNGGIALPLNESLSPHVCA